MAGPGALGVGYALSRFLAHRRKSEGAADGTTEPDDAGPGTPGSATDAADAPGHVIEPGPLDPGPEAGAANG